MKAARGLIWLAWREIRFLALAGITVFFCFPFISDLAGYLRYGDKASPWVGWTTNLLFGGTYAVIIGVALVCPDLESRLHSFVSSRPIPPFRVLWAKFKVGLFVALLVPATALLTDIAWNRFWDISSFTDSSILALVLHSLTLVFIYSIAFLMGCLLRKPVEAAIVSAAAGLLIYFLPFVLPPLNWLSVLTLISERDALAVLRKSQGGSPLDTYWKDLLVVPLGELILMVHPSLLWFVLFMVLGTLLAFIGAYQAVRRDLTFNLNQRSMAWCLGLVVILLFATGSYQVRSNLDCERLIKWKGMERSVTAIVTYGERVLLRFLDNPQPYEPSGDRHAGIQKLEIPQEVFVQESTPEFLLVRSSSPGYSEMNQMIWPEDDPRFAYTMAEDTVGNSWEHWNRKALDLCTVSVGSSTGMAVVHRLALLPLFPEAVDGRQRLPRMHHRAGKIYILSDQAAVISLAQPDAPVLERTFECKGASYSDQIFPASGEHSEIWLPQLPDFSPRERLEAWLDFGVSFQRSSMEGEILALYDQDRLTVYRLTSLNGERALIQKIGELGSTPLESPFGGISGRILFHQGYGYRLRMDGLTVYDLRDPAKPKRAGHYNAPYERFQAMAPLPNGRVLLGGNNLHVLAPPGE